MIWYDIYSEIFELMRLYILNGMRNTIKQEQIGIYIDDGINV